MVIRESLVIDAIAKLELDLKDKANNGEINSSGVDSTIERFCVLFLWLIVNSKNLEVACERLERVKAECCGMKFR